MNANIIPIQFSQGTSPTFAKTVYVNTTSPTTATIFDLNNPPTTNDNTLKSDSNNIYIGTDGSTWTYNSSTSTYSTYTYPKTVPHGFFAQIPQGTSAANNTLTTPTYSTLSNTTGGGWNPATGTFTAQRAGWYDVSANLLYTAGAWNANTQSGIVLQKNGAAIVTGGAFTTTAVTNYYLTVATISTKQYLNAGDTLRLQLYQNSGSAKATHTAPMNTFSIVEVR